MKKLLITGASGFLGWYVCQQARSHWQVYGTYHSQSVEIPGVDLLNVDITDFGALRDLFQTLQPDAVIHLAALSQPNACQSAPEVSYAVNVTAACNLAGLSSDRQIPCVFTSSDQVFDGRNAPYRENDPVCPINLYGEHKVLAEEGMRSRYPQVAICRMPLMFGNTPYANSFLQPFLKILRSGQPLSLFVDEFRTPTSGTSAAQGLLLALEKWQGLLHLGGKERISRYEFGQLMVQAFNLTDPQITACRQADVSMPAPRPADVSLDSSVAFSLGYNPEPLIEALEKLAASSSVTGV